MYGQEVRFFRIETLIDGMNGVQVFSLSGFTA
jgi:hypothetical protein